MLAFEVTVAGERLCLAGLRDWALLNVGLTGLRQHDQVADEGDIELNVGALTKPDAAGVSYRAVWNGPSKLAIGSRVTIAVVATEETDKPIRRHRSDNQPLAFTKEEIDWFDREDYARLKPVLPSQTNQAVSLNPTRMGKMWSCVLLAPRNLLYLSCRGQARETSRAVSYHGGQSASLRSGKLQPMAGKTITDRGRFFDEGIFYGVVIK